jgi:serine/threonine-protein kinase RsbW
MALAITARRRNMTLVFDIPSDFEAGRDVQRRVMDQVLLNNFEPDSIFAIRLALEEAIVNAIKHGNAQDPAKKVHVEASITPHRVEILVEDEGTGFIRSRIPDPTTHPNLNRPSGRGILLIESYMTSAKWDRGGRRVRMTRENTPLDTPQKKSNAG